MAQQHAQGDCAFGHLILEDCLSVVVVPLEDLKFRKLWKVLADVGWIVERDQAAVNQLQTGDL